MKRGTLFLVVGPSGAGKDTLLDAARERLRGDSRFFFAIRDITRPADAEGEDHRPVTEEEFQARSAAGEYLLEWSAHGLRYGIPAAAADALHNGQHVIANVSRSVLSQARLEHQPVRIVSVEVPAGILRQRLAARGREQAADIEQRLARAAAFTVSGPDVITIRNDSTVEQAVAQFLAALAV